MLFRSPSPGSGPGFRQFEQEVSLDDINLDSDFSALVQDVCKAEKLKIEKKKYKKKYKEANHSKTRAKIGDPQVLADYWKALYDETNSKLSESNARIETMRKSLNAMFSPDIVLKIESGKLSTRTRCHSELDKAKAIHNYAVLGCRRYDHMRRENKKVWPSSRTIRKWIEPINADPGILNDMILIIKDQVELMKKRDRYCNITIDEMAIHGRCDFDIGSECFTGTPTIAPTVSIMEQRRTKDKPVVKLADHVLSVMVAGLSWRYKLIVAYYLTDSSFDGELFAMEVKRIIRKLYEVGLTCKNISLDMGPCNVATLNALGVNCSR